MKVCSLVRLGLREEATVRIVASDRLDFGAGGLVPDPSDLSGLELALSWKERGEVEAVVACAVGDDTVEDSLHLAMAMGADEVVRAVLPDGKRSAEAVASAVAHVVHSSGAEIVVCGHDSSFDATGWIAYCIGACLEWPVVTGIVDVTHGDGELRVVRKLDKNAVETMRVPLPAVVAVRGSIAAARYVGRSAFARARREPVPAVIIEETGAGALSEGVGSVRVTYARPLPALIHTPAGGLSALERLEEVISAGVRAKEGKLLEGDPKEISCRLADLMSGWLRW